MCGSRLVQGGLCLSPCSVDAKKAPVLGGISSAGIEGRDSPPLLPC